MDDQFEIPIVNYRIGLDPVLGLVPGGGDWAAWVAGVYIFWVALRLDVPDRILWKMFGNIVVDLVVGYVPAAGDVVDALYKSNRKNVDLLLDHYDAHDPRRLPSEMPADTDARSPIQTYAVGIGVTLLLTLVAALPILLIWWLV
jgi:hypothetical protein